MYGWLAVLIPCAICVVVWWAALKTKKEEPKRKMTKKELEKKETKEAIFCFVSFIALVVSVLLCIVFLLIGLSSGNFPLAFFAAILLSITGSASLVTFVSLA